MASGSRRAGEPPEVSVSGIDMSYDREPVLIDVSFTVRPGTTTVVMGPSGVGKTTLMRILLGLRDPDAGDVTIGGRSVVDANPAQLKAIREDIGVLLGGSTVHDGSNFGSMTGWENVRYPLEVRGYDDAEVEERAWARMLEFDLADAAPLMPHEMSGGMRRRLGLARAFVDEPRLLVLDDPGTALDVVNRASISESIRRARATLGATVVLTCHDIPMTKVLGDDLVVLVAGRVVAAGPVAELLDGVDDAEQYDARFKVRAAFDAERSDPSRARRKADEQHRTTIERLGVATVVTLGLVSLAGIVLVVILTALTVY